MRRLILLVPIFCVALQASAQTSELRPGVKIRITAPGIVANRFEGTLLARTADSITVGSSNVQPLTIPLASVESVEISHGKSRAKGAIKGLEWGAGLGGVLGLAIMNAPTCTGSRYTSNLVCNVPPTTGQKTAAVGAMTFGGIFWGSIIGALIGSESWDRFDLAPRTAFEMHSGRPALSLSLAF